MQLILIQTEIEEALREYVGRKMTVADGNKMNIELSATRGAEGFKAVIDIVASGTPTAAAPAPFTPPVLPVKASAPEVLKQAVIREPAKEVVHNSDPVPFKSTAVPNEAREFVNTVAAVGESLTSSDPALGGATDTTGAEPGPEALSAPVEAATGDNGEVIPAPRSLFGNLKKPKN